MENTTIQTKPGVESINYTKLLELDLTYKVFQFDSKALEELYNRYSPLLYSLINGITYLDDATEEILSEVFSLIWRKIDRFDFSTGNFYSWVVTLARNKALEYIKKNKNAGIIQNKEYLGIDEDFYVFPLLSPGIDPLDINSALRLKENVDKAISEISDVQKYIIHLIYYEGFTVNGISKKLNIPRPTVLEKIRSALNDYTKHFFTEDTKISLPDDERLYFYSLGCMDTEDYPEFINSINGLSEDAKKNFGIFQIISSLLPVIVEIKKPGNEVKNKVAKKLLLVSKEGKLKRIKNLDELPSIDEINKKENFLKKFFNNKNGIHEDYEHVEIHEEFVKHEEVHQEEIPPKEIHYDTRPVLVSRPADDYDAFQKEKLVLLKNAVKKDFRKILILDFFLVIIVSALIGGSVYYFLNERLKSDQTYISNLNGKIDNLNNQLSQLNADQKIFALQNSKDAKVYPLDGTGTNNMGFGKIKIAGNGKEGLLELYNMPELPEEKTYQLWLISKGQPFSLGAFRTTRSNENFLISEFPEIEEKNIDSFLLTAENGDGSSVPSSEIYLSKDLK